MNVRIQVIIAVLVLCFLLIIITMIRNKSMELRYALAWIAVGCGILILDLFPGLMEHLARLLGIASPINMLFFMGFCFSLIIILTLTIAMSRMSVRIKNLAQEIALYEHKEDVKSDERKYIDANKKKN